MINLDSRQDRWERFVEHMERIHWPFRPYERFRAIDGNKACPPQWWSQGAGAWGCLRSHLRVVECAIRNNWKSVLVLEDDAYFHSNVTDIAKSFLQRVPPNWDQIYLGGQHLRRFVHPPVEVKACVLRVFNVNRTHAYAINRKFFVPLYHWITNFSKHAQFPRHHVDHRLGVLHRSGKFNIYSPRKWIVGQRGDHSNVKNARVPTRWWNGQAHSSRDIPDFVAILGLHRSGSSCLAGVLHKLGVHLGDHFIGYESTGGYEAIGLARICELAYPFPSTNLAIPRELLRIRLAEHIHFVQASAAMKGLALAGGKYPHLCAMGTLLTQICKTSLRIVHINRPLDLSIRSLKVRSTASSGGLHISAEKAHRVQNWLWKEKYKFLNNIAHVTIEYEDLISNPKIVIGRLINYLRLSPTLSQMECAIAHVRPEMCHHKTLRR